MSFLHREPHGDVLVLRIDRPRANAIDLDLAEELAAGLEAAAADDPAAVVLTGTGSSFSAGLDLKALPGYSVEEQGRMVRALNRMSLALYGFPRPTVAAVNGHAVAGGMIVVLGCDHRLAADGPAKFGLTEGRVGVSFPAGVLEIARAELGGATRRWMLGAGLVDVAGALADGALDERVPPDELRDRALARAGELGALPRPSYHAIKLQLRGDALERIRRAVDEGDPLEGAWLAPHVADAVREILG